MVSALTSAALAALPTIKHGFFLRCGGVSTGDFASLNCGLSSADAPECVAENRRRVAAYMGVDPMRFLSCYQVHSADVITVTEPWDAATRPTADALVTAERGLAIGVLTADCAPVLLADATAGVIGAAHAGWRGAVGGVLQNTVAAMESLGAQRNRIHAAIGACIWQDSYEVGSDFPLPFLSEDETNVRFFRPSTQKPRHYMFDLPAYVAAKLAQLGLADVASSLADTLSDDKRFFSYRRQCLAGRKVTGTMPSVICLR